jgi:hypothetical protein
MHRGPFPHYSTGNGAELASTQQTIVPPALTRTKPRWMNSAPLRAQPPI